MFSCSVFISQLSASGLRGVARRSIEDLWGICLVLKEAVFSSAHGTDRVSSSAPAAPPGAKFSPSSCSTASTHWHASEKDAAHLLTASAFSALKFQERLPQLTVPSY